jgi:hypothetical protein
MYVFYGCLIKAKITNFVLYVTHNVMFLVNYGHNEGASDWSRVSKNCSAFRRSRLTDFVSSGGDYDRRKSRVNTAFENLGSCIHP